MKHPGAAPSWGDKEPDGYDHEIAFVDVQVNRVLAALATRMGAEPYLVIVTSDHGEKFRTPTHRDHGHDLEEESIRVPLIIRGPGFPAGRVSDAIVSLVDLFPTVLTATRTPVPEGIDGIDLGPVVNGTVPLPQRTLITETWRLGPDRVPTVDMVAAYDGRFNLILDRVNNDQILKTQARVGQPVTTLTGKRPPPELQNALDHYLEETGGALRIVD